MHTDTLRTILKVTVFVGLTLGAGMVNAATSTNVTTPTNTAVSNNCNGTDGTTCQNPIIRDSNGQPVGGAHLFPGLGTVNKVIISAPLDPASVTNQSYIPASGCLTLSNVDPSNQTAGYFVPWKSKLEWTSFIKAVDAGNLPYVSWQPGCCEPMRAGTVLKGLACNQKILNDKQIGGRIEGQNNGNPINSISDNLYYGGIGDSVAMSASDLLGTNAVTASINQRFNFACAALPDSIGIQPYSTGVDSKGKTVAWNPRYGWTLNTMAGTCTTTSASCANITALAALPVDLNTLCGAGNIASNVTPGQGQGAGPWTWTCSGTPDAKTPTMNCKAAQASTASLCSPAVSTGLVTIPANTSDLCVNGGTLVTGSLTGKGPWSWTCASGSTNENCSTWAVPQDGVCGTAQGAPMSATPTATTPNLCAGGYPKDMGKSDANFVWSCAHYVSGKDADCSVPMYGKCGPLDETATTLAPDPVAAAASLCSFGTTTNPPFYGPTNWKGFGGQKAWIWTCDYGLPCNNSSCQCAALDATASTKGICGDPSTFKAGNTTRAPSGNVCLPLGTKPTSGPTFDSSTNTWTWTCPSVNGNGISATCQQVTAPPPDSACGSDDGKNIPLTKTPTNLCSLGTASVLYSGAQAITLSGDSQTSWYWTCTGPTSSKKCSAVLPGSNGKGRLVNGACNATLLPSDPLTFATTNPTALCLTGTFDPASVVGTDPWSWTCLGANKGTNATCTGSLQQAQTPSSTTPPPPLVTLTKYPSCGLANGLPDSSVPNTSLCKNGSDGLPSQASIVAGATLTGWTWTCMGDSSSIPASCSAPICSLCLGTGISGTKTSATFSNTMVDSAGNACNVLGYETWAESLVIASSVNPAETIGWTDVFHDGKTNPAFSVTEFSFQPSSPAALGQVDTTPYCTPCLAQATGVVAGSAHVTVSAAPGQPANNICASIGLGPNQSITKATSTPTITP